MWNAKISKHNVSVAPEALLMSRLYCTPAYTCKANQSGTCTYWVRASTLAPGRCRSSSTRYAQSDGSAKGEDSALLTSGLSVALAGTSFATLFGILPLLLTAVVEIISCTLDMLLGVP